MKIEQLQDVVMRAKENVPVTVTATAGSAEYLEPQLLAFNVGGANEFECLAEIVRTLESYEYAVDILVRDGVKPQSYWDEKFKTEGDPI